MPDDEKHEHAWHKVKDVDSGEEVGIHCPGCGAWAMKE